ncbi:leucine zipper putative tumor suppressor 1 [Thunnus albacares]|uniref:leucine zipper putative tumor suppressor 1 n=1 Tax=Thunnus maccoyii TaxID=8240 RepID=UPI001C4CE061|nr:leucine zipper putative tumor suppressor 1 [Thunnus maccoyii]XP_042277012.1 leucine zipper putative tumor suppressor 1 [Thunnus maccoyii]XP_042277013.1 leucine zipper putative tumor suppressor 1 [Thunnus maccoyii]XP_044224876.1 leucine zipper putative tumor suppressor 1 [Thunnus albacares]XP_044224884.1 leucine zipper putative tumor suppressor 1 [Thunnus albacares]XP_044224892.1 leucine zipper putative tumor suppressor 1 [Thunnus albacares]
MGSVSSLISGNSLDSKHCKASEFRLKRGTNHNRKSGGCSLDGLLKCSFTQGSSSSTHLSKGLSHSRSGRSEDFFYIKVGHKPRSVYHRGGSMEEHTGRRNRDGESDGHLQPKLLLMSGKMTERTTAEKSLVRSTAFKPVFPRSTTSTGHNSLDHILGPLEKARSPDNRNKQDTFSGTLSDSGRNSMSSLPTHSTSGSLSASAGPVSHSDGGSAPASSLSKGPQPNFPPWVSGNSANLDCSYRAGLNSGGLASKANGEAGSSLSADEPSPLSETAGGIRSPITTDESLIENLEQRLLERETELQELQVSFEEKEADTCQLFEERQRYCAEEMEGLKQRCSTKLRQVSQMAAKTQQALQLQVSQLQAEKDRLQEDVLKLTREKDLVELRLRSYETESTRLAPTLEETQWEVCQKAGEISLLKQQLRDCQADVSHKLNEIVSLRVSLKEITAKTEMLEKQNKDHGDKLHSRTREAEVCQNELQRKKNEADLLREKVGKLEKDIQGMKQDLAMAKEQRLQHSLQLEAHAQTQALEGLIQGSDSPIQSQEEETKGHTSTESLQKEVERLKQQLREEKDAQERLANSFEQERQTWNKEKDRVIKYQKQLQINYLQMHKKNQDLERILKELTAELESRTELGMDINYSSGLQTYDDVIATEI